MDFPDFKREQIALEKVFKYLPTWAGNAAVNFYKDSWRRQGFIDRRFERWPKRRNGADKDRALLIGSGSGRLRRSIRFSTSGNYIAVSTDVIYAEVHNEGGTITQIVTPLQRRFFWANYAESKRQGRMKDADMWRAMALSQKLTIKMPKRQFMDIEGKPMSWVLDQRIYMHVARALEASIERRELLK